MASTTTSPTPARGGELARLYEANIGAITPLVAQELGDIADDYAAEWFEAAVREALANNVRSLKYIKAILERWSRDGFKAPLRRKPASGAGVQPARGLPNAQELEKGWTPGAQEGDSP